MGRLKSSNYKFILTITLGIIMGILIGGAIINALISYRIDKYIEEIEYLKASIENKDAKLIKLEESINKQKLILKDIQVVFINEDDKIDKIEIEKYIKKKFITLIGKEVKTIDTDILEQVINKRIITINNNQYELNIFKIILTDILEIWIKIKPIN
jgi:hypothetical protein